MTESLVIVEHGKSLRSLVPAERQSAASSPMTLADALRSSGDGAVWLARSAPLVRWLSGVAPGQGSRHRLLLLGEASAPDRAFLRSFFEEVVTSEPGLRLLPLPALVRVLAAEGRGELLIGAAVARLGKSVVLYRGNLETLVVPCAWFTSRPGGPRPDFSEVEVIDHGQTLRLGAYEAATDAILYEFDPRYRRASRRRRLAEDTSFGASLRRLRLQKGLAREDFGALSAKTIARLERGEVARPHAHTLRALARRLRVKPAQLGSF